jgi:hypothetical protein
MPAKPIKDACEEGMLKKEAGALECSKHNGDYICMVAILLASGQTRRFGAC